MQQYVCWLEWVMNVEVCLPLAFGLFVSQIGRGSDIVHHALSDEAAIEVMSHTRCLIRLLSGKCS